MRYEPDWYSFESQLSEMPHHLFMLNKSGQTPLDVAILETIAASDSQQSQSARNTRLENAKEKTQMLILRM